MTPGSEPELTPLAKRDFKTVTTTKNRIVKAINNSLSDEAIIEYLHVELPKALDEYLSIVFELAGLEPKIQSKSDFAFLKNLDFQALLTSDRLIDTQVKETKFISLLEETLRSNKEVVTTVKQIKNAPVSKPDQVVGIQATMTRVEKVIQFFEIFSTIFYLTNCLDAGTV